METKDLIGLTLVPLAVMAGVLITCLSQWARDAAFFVLVAAAPLTHKLDVNFASHYWYRGTTRGFEFSLLDVLALSVLVSSLLTPRRHEHRWFWPAGLAPMLVFFFWACISTALADPKIYGLFELSKMLRGLVVFLAAAVFVRSRRELAILIVALCCAVCFEVTLGIKQRYADGIYRVTGSIDHANSLSMYLCMVAPVFVAAANSELPALVRHFASVSVGFAGIGVLLTISRAGIPIFALVTLGATLLCMSWRVTAQKIVVAVLIPVVGGALVYRSWDSLKARYGEATLEEEYFDEQMEGRGLYFRFARAIIEDRPFGVGLNNWSYWVSKKYGPELGWRYEDYADLDYLPSKELLPSFHYAAPAHNLGALTLGELGAPGLLFFAVMWLCWFQAGLTFLRRRSPDPMLRLGVGIFFSTCGIFLQSVTEWTYRQTPIFLTFHVLLGTLASLHHFKEHRKRHRLEHHAQPAELAAHAEPMVAVGGKG